jgi:hypothetical protein
LSATLADRVLGDVNPRISTPTRRGEPRVQQAVSSQQYRVSGVLNGPRLRSPGAGGIHGSNVHSNGHQLSAKISCANRFAATIMVACYKWGPLAEITRRCTGELLRKLFKSLMQSSDGRAAGNALKRALGIRGRRRCGGRDGNRPSDLCDHRLDGGPPLERQQATVHLVGDLGWRGPPLSAVPRTMSTTVHRRLSDGAP